MQVQKKSSERPKIGLQMSKDGVERIGPLGVGWLVVFALASIPWSDIDLGC
jgi:hypothetical protein